MISPFYILIYNMIRLFSGHMALIFAEILTYPIVNIKLAEPGMGSWVDTIGWVDDGRCPLGESLGIIFLHGLHPLSPEVGFIFFLPCESRLTPCVICMRMYGLVGLIIFNHLMDKRWYFAYLLWDLTWQSTSAKLPGVKDFLLALWLFNTGPFFGSSKPSAFEGPFLTFSVQPVLWVKSIPDVQFSRIFRGTAAAFSTSSLLGVSFS